MDAVKKLADSLDAAAPKLREEWAGALTTLAAAGARADALLIAAEKEHALADQPTAGVLRTPVTSVMVLARKTWEAHGLMVECLRGLAEAQEQVAVARGAKVG